MDETLRVIKKTAFFPLLLTAAWILFSAITLTADEGSYFLLPEEIARSYFPVSEEYMIPHDESIKAIMERAKIYEEQKNYRQAARYYGFAYTRSADSKAAPYIRFKQSFLLERSSDSISMLHGILESHQDFPYADAVRFELARRYYLKGEYDKAKGSLDGILENEDGEVKIFSPYVLTFFGILNQAEGRYQEAESFHTDAIEILASTDDGKKTPYIVVNYLEVSRCLLARNELDRAEDLLRRIIGTAESPLVKQEAYMLLAESYSRSDGGAAAAVYKELLDEFPGSMYRKKAEKSIAGLGREDEGLIPTQILGYYDPAVLQGRYEYGAQPKTSSIEGKYFIQIGSFSVEENAENLVGILKQKGYGALIVETDMEEKRLFRVRVGGYGTVDEAQKAKQNLESLGYGGFIVQGR